MICVWLFVSSFVFSCACLFVCFCFVCSHVHIKFHIVTGDAVLFGDTTVTVNIAANDDPNGVVQFSSASLNKTIIEGSTTNFV